MTSFENAISLAAETRIDELCDQFEATWSSTSPESIEQLLSALPAEPDRSALLRALLELELELLARGDRVPVHDDYRHRFPNHEAIVADVFQQFQWSQVQNAEDCDALSTIELVPADTSRTQPESATTAPMPTHIGRFEVQEVLGRGGFGTVYRARDPKVGRDVAIKIPRTQRFTSATDASRFLREAKAAALLRHANVCAVHDVGEADGQAFIVMDYIAGEPLSAILGRGERLASERILQIVRELALALGCVHREGIIHRDLKPANVIIDNSGTPIIMDFGLARLSAADDDAITLGGEILGTPAYMPPEQARGDIRSISPASDIYSLGAILYELLCGQRPYRGSGADIVCQILRAAPPPLSAHDPRINRELEAVCRKAMARKPRQRYQTMAEFAGALSKVSFDPNAARRRYRRVRLAAALLSFVTLAAAITYVQTDKGWLRIAADEDVQLVVTQGGREITIIDTKTQSRVRLRSGEYEIELRGDRNDVTLSKSRFAMTRGDHEIVSVQRTSVASTTAESSHAEVKMRAKELPTEIAATDRKPIHVESVMPAKAENETGFELSRAPAFLKGKWRVENGELVTEPTDAEPRQLLTFGDPNWTDYDVRFDVCCERQTLTYSVVCRYNANQEYWLFSFGGWGPKNADLVSILADEDGYRHPSRRWLPDTLHGQPNVWQNVEVKARGENIRVSVDGKELATSSHPRLIRGLIGFYTFSPGMVRWRNLEVRTPDGKLLWEGFPNLSQLQTDASEEQQDLNEATNSQLDLTDSVRDGIAKLKQTLIEHSWLYRDSLYPAGDRCEFRADGTFHKWRWKYWVVGPREMRVHYSKSATDPDTGILLTFDENLTTFRGSFTEQRHGTHVITGTRQ